MKPRIVKRRDCWICELDGVIMSYIFLPGVSITDACEYFKKYGGEL